MTGPLISPLAHIPGMFTHYSPRTGSALITKVYNHALEHERAGGRTYVLVSGDRRSDYAAGHVRRFDSDLRRGPEWFTTKERGIDAVIGSVTGARPMASRFYRPAMAAVPTDVAALIVYNQASAVTPRWRHDFAGLAVLHLGNDIFKHWSPRHIRSALQRHDLVVAVSGHTAEAVNRRAGLDIVKVLLNGVDTSIFRPSDEVRTGRPRILFVGNMVRHKGAHNLLAASRLLVSTGLDFEVRIVGSWGLTGQRGLTAYEKELRELAAPLQGRVSFGGFADRTAVAHEFRKASVFCMPVEWDEPAGQVVTEAMASGLPVVSARRGGIAEYLGNDGFYVDPLNRAELASALHEVLSDPVAARARGSLLRRRAENMTWERRVREFDALLRAV